MTLKLYKIQEGLMNGNVVYHRLSNLINFFIHNKLKIIITINKIIF